MNHFLFHFPYARTIFSFVILYFYGENAWDKNGLKMQFQTPPETCLDIEL